LRIASGKIFFFIIIILVLGWAALGPGLRLYVDSRSSDFIDSMKKKSNGLMVVDSVGGDFWSGITLNKVIIYTDNDPDHLPILDAQSVNLTFPLSCILTQDYTPSHIHISNFNIALHIDEDGTVALPEWAFKTADTGSRILHTGFVLSGGSAGKIGFSCENGVLEIIKRFPKLTEPVDININHLAGNGTYSSNRGIDLTSLTGDYLTSKTSLHGFIPKDKSEPLDLDADFSGLQLTDLFKDIDPLFRGNKYLPSGDSSGKVKISGPGNKVELTGEFDLTNGILGNVAVGSAQASVAYKPGTVELTKVTASAYGGKIDGAGEINLLSEAPLWNLNFTVDKLDLGQYLVSNGYYAYEIKGDFSGTGEAKGDFKSRSALTCNASIESNSGTYLSPFSEKFMAIAQKTKKEAEVKESDIVNYDEAKIELEIKDSLIRINKYHFLSYDLNVDAKGVVGFNKSINVSGGLSVPLAKARKNRKLGIFVALLPDSLSRANLEFSLEGFLNNVKFNARPTENLIRSIVDNGSDALHKTGDAFTGGVNPDIPG
jgi:hypothetical protein